MLNFIYNILFNLLIQKGDVDMMAMLFAQKIILGKLTFNDVPAKLKEQVKEVLIECGCEYLIEE